MAGVMKSPRVRARIGRRRGRPPVPRTGSSEPQAAAEYYRQTQGLPKAEQDHQTDKETLRVARWLPGYKYVIPPWVVARVDALTIHCLILRAI